MRLHYVVIGYMVLISNAKCEDNVKDEGLLDKLKSGLKYAKKLLGVDISAKVAQLVSTAFNDVGNEKRASHSKGINILAGLMKTLSTDVTKIGAIVLNAFVFLAKIIRDSLIGKSAALPTSGATDGVHNGSPLDWIAESGSPTLRGLMAAAQDEHLTSKVVQAIRQRSEEGGIDTDCVQLLVCRIEPIIKGMQSAVQKRQLDDDDDHNDTGVVDRGAMFRYLPSVREFEEHGQTCKQRHERCKITIRN